MPEPAYSELPLAGGSDGHSTGGRPLAARLPKPADGGAGEAGEAGDGRGSVVVREDLDLDSTRRLRPELLGALSRSARGIDVDLGEVGFCDCSGLNLLLSLRQEAMRQGKTVTVRRTSPAVERLLDLTGATSLFGPADGADEAPPRASPEDPAPGQDSDQDLRVVIAQLRQAMQTRPTIDLARGILMSSFGLTPERAWDVLVSASQNTNTKLRSLAEDLVGATVSGNALPETTCTHIVAAAGKGHAPTKGPCPGTTATGAGPCRPPGGTP